nr:ECF transporter S component [Bifidobacterium pongonis]
MAETATIQPSSNAKENASAGTASPTNANATESTATPAKPTDHAIGAHSTGVADHGRWSTRRIAMYALFVALAMAASLIELPIFPAAPWLKYDPSGIVCLVAGFAFGPYAAAIVSILGFMPHVFTSPWGALMGMLVALAISVPASLVYRRNRTRGGAMRGMALGMAIALVVALISNLLVTPLYAHMTMAQVAAMILPILLPFNLLKFAIHAVVTFLIYKPITTLLDRAA